MTAIKVHELNKYLKKCISMDYLLTNIEVEGEISNFKYHTNGNMYLSLKDEYAKINAMVYGPDVRSIDFEPKDGDNVLVRGQVSLFDRDASIRIFIREMKLKGLGDLYERYLKLKENLYKEGLFDETNKKEIPYFPKRVGVITAQTGAAVRDIINVLRRRNNAIDIILYPSLVQGEKAAENLIRGVKYFNSSKCENPVDLIIIGRGGGGYEDLFCFNDEKLAREIYKSEIPVISGVGHEVDYVISDFVSDLRAPTPSAAAELASMSKYDLLNRLDLSFDRLNSIMLKSLNEKELELVDKNSNIKSIALDRIKFEEKELENNLNMLNKVFKSKLILEKSTVLFAYKNLIRNKPNKIIYEKRRFLENRSDVLNNNILILLNEKKSELFELKDRLTIPNDYTVFIKDINEKPIVSAAELNPGNDFKVIFDDGTVCATVKE